MFANGKQLIFNGGTFIEQRGQRLDLDRLWKEVAPNALYNSNARFDPPRCHPNTRRAVFDRLHTWIRGQPALPITWLYGPAGAGKSAILQTMAEECDKNGTLLASFYFWKTDPTRNHPRSFVATISYQIMSKIPALKPFFHAALDRDQFIFDKSIEVQMEQLVIEPLKHMFTAGFFGNRATSPRLIIVDGVDECNDQTLRAMLLRAIARSLTNHDVPIIFLISSRPEQDITHTFNSPPMAKNWVSLVLGYEYQPSDDIRLFLQDSFAEIKATHPRRHAIPSDWPGDSVIDCLVCKSSGQFLFSAVVIKYISTLSDLPHRRLDVIMGLRPAVHDLPFAEIDALYTHLLSSVPDHSTETVLDILFLVLYRNIIYGVNKITPLLDLEDGDVELLLAPLSSIITIYPYSGDISFSHASLSDFLRDRTRSGKFYIDMASNRLIRMAGQAVKYLNSDTWAKPISEAITDQGASIYLIEAMIGFISTIIRNFDLNDELYEVLRILNLENIWPLDDTIRSNMIPYFLRSLRNIDDRNLRVPNYKQLYDIYIGSLASILRGSMTVYLSDAALTAYMIVYLTAYQIRDPTSIRYFINSKSDIHSYLLQIPKTVNLIDNDPLRFGVFRESCSGIITDFLFDPAAPEHLSLYRRDFDNTAIRILTYLCKKWRCPSSRLNLRTKDHGGFKTRFKKTYFKPHNSRQFRTRRVQFGHTRTLKLSKNSKRFEPCTLGLQVLPEILEKCGGSQPLAEYIRLHMKDMAVINPWTRLARNALLDYLTRTACDDQSELEVEIKYYDPTTPFYNFY